MERPPAAPPRRSAQRLAVVGILAAGLMMLLMALVSPGDPASAGLTALAGTVALGLSASAVAEVASSRTVGLAALLLGVGCVAGALAPEQFDGPEVARLLTGGTIVVCSIALLPGRQGGPVRR